jgi:hypothetical protein
MFVLTLGRESRINPVLFASGIVTHVGIAYCCQFTGSVLGSISSRLSAVNHNVRSLVRQEG